MSYTIAVYHNTVSLAGNALSNQSAGSWAIRKAKGEEAPNLYLISMQTPEGKPIPPIGFKTKEDLINYLILNKDVLTPEKAISCLPSLAAESITVTYSLSEAEKINKVIDFLKEHTGYEWAYRRDAGRVYILTPNDSYYIPSSVYNNPARKEARNKENAVVEQAMEKAKEICELADVKLQEHSSKHGLSYNYFNFENTLRIYDQLDVIKEKLSSSPNSIDNSL